VVRLAFIDRSWVASILRRRTLIIGEVGTGKTKLTADIIKMLLEMGFKKDISIIDLGPGKKDVGSPLSKYLGGFYVLTYLYSPDIYAPRLMARDSDELMKYIELNYREAKKLFKIYLSHPTRILVINDLSIFLHRGTVKEIMDIIKESDTFIGNAYYGSRIKDKFDTGIDEVERQRVEELIEYMDKVINLNLGGGYTSSSPRKR